MSMEDRVVGRGKGLFMIVPVQGPEDDEVRRERRRFGKRGRAGRTRLVSGAKANQMRVIIVQGRSYCWVL